MTIFAVIQQPHPSHSALSVAIFQAYPDDTYDLGNGAWLISDSVTAKEVSDKIGISDGTNGSAVVIEAASYFGRANPAIWSWIKAKWEGGPNG